MSTDYTSLEAVAKWTRINCRRHFDHPNFEDAIQEALIRAWKDIESGKYSKWHILNRAKTWAMAYFREADRRFTGAPPLSTDGKMPIAVMDEMFDVVKYRKEYRKIYGEYPTNLAVAHKLGISTDKIDRHVARFSTGSYDHAHYVPNLDGSRRLSPTYYIKTYIDGGPVDVPKVEVQDTTWEESNSASWLDFLQLLKGLEESHREVLYMRCVLAWTTTEIGEYYGYTKNLNQNGYKKVKAAMQAARELIETEENEDA